MKTLKEWLRESTPEERKRVAKESGTSVAYLYQIAGKHRTPSLKLIARLNISLDKQVDMKELLPELSSFLETA